MVLEGKNNKGGDNMKINVYENSFRVIPFNESEPYIEITNEQLEKLSNFELTIKNGQLVDNTINLQNMKRLKDLENWFDSYFDKMLAQSLWQTDFSVSPDPYFVNAEGKALTYQNIGELKVKAESIRNEIKALKSLLEMK